MIKLRYFLSRRTKIESLQFGVNARKNMCGNILDKIAQANIQYFLNFLSFSSLFLLSFNFFSTYKTFFLFLFLFRAYPFFSFLLFLYFSFFDVIFSFLQACIGCLFSNSWSVSFLFFFSINNFGFLNSLSIIFLMYKIQLYNFFNKKNVLFFILFIREITINLF